MKRKILAIAIVFVGVCVIAFPFVRTLWADKQAAQLLTKLESGESMTVDVQKVKEGELESWAESDGLDTFDYQDEADDLRLSGERTDVVVEVGADDGAVDPSQEAALGDIGLDATTQGEALDVEGLKRKRLVAIGKIDIPSIDASLPIVEGAGKTELHYATGHVVGTADFGRVGNSVVAGHRNYTFGSMFNRLGELKSGDDIVVTMRDGTIVKYKVYETVDVKPGDKQITNFFRNESRMTLITCTPMGIATERLLVRARMVDIVEPT